LRVELAKSAGFCFGVNRAVDLVYNEIKNNKKVYTLGPIIHNEEFVNQLKQQGVDIINDIDEIKNLESGTIIIRSHGISQDIYDILNNSNHNIVDATCPFVKKIHNIVQEKTKENRHIVIIGNDNHPEVEGIKGWCKNNSTVIETEEDANNFDIDKNTKICVVSQTTFNSIKFKYLVEIISKKGYDIIVLNTICNATEKRQKESYELAKRSDAMIVIGGKNSSNTQKLYSICKKECPNTYYIHTLSDFDVNFFKVFNNIGITAGASTPNNIIKEVYTQCQKLVLNNY